jgi:hypothetical protein
MSHRNIATRMVSPAPADRNSLVARSRTVGSRNRVCGEEKHVSRLPWDQHPDFPTLAADDGWPAGWPVR